MAEAAKVNVDKKLGLLSAEEVGKRIQKDLKPSAQAPKRLTA